MNKKQTARALVILRELYDSVPVSFVTNGEAAVICNRYGVTDTRFHRASSANLKSINLAQIAATIAQKEAR